ncbi:MAG: hypothetical protein AAF503_06305 [Pseudomonadota bacterium]
MTQAKRRRVTGRLRRNTPLRRLMMPLAPLVGGLTLEFKEECSALIASKEMFATKECMEAFMAAFTEAPPQAESPSTVAIADMSPDDKAMFNRMRSQLKDG